MGPVNIPPKFEVRGYTRSWNNRGYCSPRTDRQTDRRTTGRCQ